MYIPVSRSSCQDTLMQVPSYVQLSCHLFTERAVDEEQNSRSLQQILNHELSAILYAKDSSVSLDLNQS